MPHGCCVAFATLHACVHEGGRRAGCRGVTGSRFPLVPWLSECIYLSVSNVHACMRSQLHMCVNARAGMDLCKICLCMILMFLEASISKVVNMLNRSILGRAEVEISS